MITGIIATDANNYHMIEMTPTMVSPMTNSFWFIRGITEGTNIVTTYDAWKRLSRLEEIPSSESVFINVSVDNIRRIFPLTPITIIGNDLVEQQLPNIKRLIQVKYNEDLADQALLSQTKFPFPPHIKPNILAVLPHFKLIEYVLDEDDPIDLPEAVNSTFT